MRRKLQVYLSIGLFSLTLLGFIVFSLLAYRYIHQELVAQILEDNEAMGERMLHGLAEVAQTEQDTSQFIATLQRASDRLALPNGGFVCATDLHGSIVAAPGLQPLQASNWNELPIQSFENMQPTRFETLTPNDTLRGFITFPDEGRTDIIYSRAVPEMGVRLLVHQDLAIVEARAWSHVKPLLGLGLGISILVSLMSFYLVRGLVKSYESELKGLNDDLIHANENLIAINNERKQLIHLLSHDLVNPLGSVLSALELIEMDPEEQERYIEIIRMGAEHSIGIVSLVRQLQAMDSGKLELTVRPVNLRQMVEHSRKIVEARAQEKEITLLVDVPASTQVMAEPVSLVNSVLNNLFTNAIKFSARGSRIEVTASQQSNNVLLIVRDHGIGMPPRMLENLFSLVHKTSRSGTDGEQGTGFGMPLVKRFMEAYGGLILVQSREEAAAPDSHGTEISLYFKIA